MITTRNVSYEEKGKNARQLRKDGFVSAKGLHATESTRSLKLPLPAKLKKLANTDALECIKCSVNGTISYWYKLSDLQKLYS